MDIEISGNTLSIFELLNFILPLRYFVLFLILQMISFIFFLRKYKFTKGFSFSLLSSICIVPFYFWLAIYLTYHNYKNDFISDPPIYKKYQNLYSKHFDKNEEFTDEMKKLYEDLSKNKEEIRELIKNISLNYDLKKLQDDRYRKKISEEKKQRIHENRLKILENVKDSDILIYKEFYESVESPLCFNDELKNTRCNHFNMSDYLDLLRLKFLYLIFESKDQVEIRSTMNLLIDIHNRLVEKDLSLISKMFILKIRLFLIRDVSLIEEKKLRRELLQEFLGKLDFIKNNEISKTIFLENSMGAFYMRKKFKNARSNSNNELFLFVFGDQDQSIFSNIIYFLIRKTGIINFIFDYQEFLKNNLLIAEGLEKEISEYEKNNGNKNFEISYKYLSPHFKSMLLGLLKYHLFEQKSFYNIVGNSHLSLYVSQYSEYVKRWVEKNIEIQSFSKKILIEE